MKGGLVVCLEVGGIGDSIGLTAGWEGAGLAD